MSNYSNTPKKIGVLALQGGFAEHINSLNQLNVSVTEVRHPKHLEKLDGMIIPGGESTVISHLLHEQNLIEPIIKRFHEGMGIWGTCAGAILLAKRGSNLKHSLKLMDISIQRNAFGRQKESFITNLNFNKMISFPAVFIRAPIIKSAHNQAKILIRLNDEKCIHVTCCSKVICKYYLTRKT